VEDVFDLVEGRILVFGDTGAPQVGSGQGDGVLPGRVAQPEDTRLAL